MVPRHRTRNLLRPCNHGCPAANMNGTVRPTRWFTYKGHGFHLPAPITPREPEPAVRRACARGRGRPHLGLRMTYPMYSEPHWSDRPQRIPQLSTDLSTSIHRKIEAVDRAGSQPLHFSNTKQNITRGDHHGQLNRIDRADNAEISTNADVCRCATAKRLATALCPDNGVGAFINRGAPHIEQTQRPCNYNHCCGSTRQCQATRCGNQSGCMAFPTRHGHG